MWGAALAAEEQQTECAHLLAAEPPNADDEAGQRALFLCQLHESSALLNQLSTLVSDGVDGLLESSGIKGESATNLEKRKHEYLRFGKRKHEYLRFGKRKHEYLRFGKKKHEYLRFGRK